MSTITLRQPTDQEITEWWEWAAGFTGDDTPFASGKGGNIVHQAQDKSTYCLSCTGGKGGKDKVTRNLQPAIAGHDKDILIPVFVAGADDLDDAHKELGSSPSITLEINGVDRSGDVQKRVVSIDGVNFQGSAETHPLGMAGLKNRLHSVGYWVVIPSNQKNQLKSIRFGGAGGKLSAGSPEEFETEVTYG